MKKIVVLFVCLLSFSCKDKFKKGVSFYSDNFEKYSSINELISDDEKNWNEEEFTIDGNYHALDSTNIFRNKQSLYYFATKTENVISKSTLGKTNLSIEEGKTVKISAWYYLKVPEQKGTLFICDLEEITDIGAWPGMRLAVQDGYIFAEYKFYDVKENLFQNDGNKLQFPLNEWVLVEWEMKLAQRKKGSIKVWQNGNLLIDKKDIQTMPRDVLYSTQGSKGIYNSIQYGITANSREQDTELWIDDVKLQTFD